MAPLREPLYWDPVGTKTPQFGGTAQAEAEKIKPIRENRIVFLKCIFVSVKIELNKKTNPGFLVIECRGS
jgi:hypothetical protein